MIGISSFSDKGYKKYGKNFLKYAHNFPGKIIVYTESRLGIASDQIEERDLFGIPGINGFLENIKNIPKAHGIVRGGYDYNFDANKFCRKMFCQFDAFKDGGKMYWLDGDTQINKKIPRSLLEDLFSGEPLVYLGREGFYTESGIVGFDTDHPDFYRFSERYMDTLRKGIVFGLKGWHDCYCFDWAKEDFGNDLTPEWKKGDNLKVLNKTKLAKYMVHHKGNRKDAISKD